MKNFALVMVLLSVPSIVFAQNQSKAFIKVNDAGGYLVTSTGPITAEYINFLNTTTVPGPVVPGPITPGPVIPPSNFMEIMEAACKAVPDYEGKDEHAKGIAYSISFISPYLKGTGDVQKITATLKSLSDAAMGEDASKWSDWWVTLDNTTKGMSNAQYKEALAMLPECLTSHMSFDSGESFGVENYGLDPAQLMKWIELILKYLPIILQLFA